jgi:hypothetical protein
MSRWTTRSVSSFDVMLIPQLDRLLALDCNASRTEMVVRGRQLRGIAFDGELAAIFELREPIAILVHAAWQPDGRDRRPYQPVFRHKRGPLGLLPGVQYAPRDAIHRHPQYPARGRGVAA